MVIDGALSVNELDVESSAEIGSLTVQSINVIHKATTEELEAESGIDTPVANVDTLYVGEDGLFYNGVLYSPITLTGNYIDGTPYTLTVLGRLS